MIPVLVLQGCARFGTPRAEIECIDEVVPVNSAFELNGVSASDLADSWNGATIEFDPPEWPPLTLGVSVIRLRTEHVAMKRSCRDYEDRLTVDGPVVTAWDEVGVDQSALLVIEDLGGPEGPTGNVIAWFAEPDLEEPFVSWVNDNARLRDPDLGPLVGFQLTLLFPDNYAQLHAQFQVEPRGEAIQSDYDDVVFGTRFTLVEAI